MKLFLYIKFLFMALVSTIFYYESFATLLREMPFEWMLFSLIIAFLALFLIYQKREALKALIAISKSDKRYGILFLSLSLILFFIQAYFPTEFSNALLSFSSSFFVASLVAFLFDSRIIRSFFIVFMASPFIFPPISHFRSQPIELKFAANLLGIVAVLGLELFIAKASREKNGSGCLFCASKLGNEQFCAYCGKLLSKLSSKFRRTDIPKILGLLFLVCTLSISFIPVLTVSDRGGYVQVYSFHGTKTEHALIPPIGWIEVSSERLSAYEKEHSEDYALLVTYSNGENYSQVFFEMGPKEPYVMNLWQLPGWQKRIFLENIPITDGTVGKCYVLEKQQNTIVVLRSRTLTYIFQSETGFQRKKVGISTLMNFSSTLSDPQIYAALEILKVISASCIQRLVYLNVWTERFSTVTQFFSLSKDVFLSAIAVVTLFAFASYTRQKDTQMERLTDKAFWLSTSEIRLIEMIKKMRKKRFTGRELFEKYSDLAKNEVNFESIYKSLKILERKGFLKKDLIAKGKNAVMVWVFAL